VPAVVDPIFKSCDRELQRKCCKNLQHNKWTSALVGRTKTFFLFLKKTSYQTTMRCTYVVAAILGSAPTYSTQLTYVCKRLHKPNTPRVFLSMGSRCGPVKVYSFLDNFYEMLSGCIHKREATQTLRKSDETRKENPENLTSLLKNYS
jgi:hypothetical protein